ncbi:MAG: hypothetical protein IH984_00030 [Planctomycetes bacterium]|nr:hypothetical protein [Planctomycetota bacterium]
MTSFCICNNSRMGAAIVALLVTAGFTNALASATENKPEFDVQVNQAFGLRNSTVVTLDLPDINDRALVVELQINEQGYTLALQPHSVRAKNFVCYEVLADGTLVEVDPGPERTVRGTLLEDDGSIIAGSLLDDGLIAKIQFSNGDQYWIEPLAGRVAGAAPGSHVLYNSDDILEHGGVCGNPDGPGNLANEAHVDDDPLAGGNPDCITQLAVEADFPYFQRYGTIPLVATQIESVINVMNTQYENDVDITHVISAMLIRTTAAADPYTTNDSFDLICQVGNYWDTNLGFITRDTVQLFTGRDIAGSTIGRAATFGGICEANSCGFFPCDGCGVPGEAAGHYSFVQSDFNGNFGCATDLSAHELGHLWNAQHCSCSGCTMHSFIQCANSFCGPGIAATIITFRNLVTCLDCTGDASLCGDPDAGSCFVSNASPFCASVGCCNTVCAVDPFCCNTRWDQQCANEALDLCGNCGEPDSGGCLQINDNPGCSDSECCAIVCMFDPFCCISNWDLQCTNEAAEFCSLVSVANDVCEDAIAIIVPNSVSGNTDFATVDNGFPICDGVTITAPGVWYSVFGTGTTMTAHTCSDLTGYNTKISVYCNGCIEPICVSGNDDDCDLFAGPSTVSWCSEDAREYLILVHGSGNATGGFTLSVFADAVACDNPDGCFDSPCDPESGDCCVANGTPGCDDALCCLIVCANDPFCCDTEWDSSCAIAANESCIDCDLNDTCDAGAGDCCVAGGNGTPGCDDVTCCDAVCAIDPFCCVDTWDSKCAGEAADLCAICAPPSDLIWFTNQAEFEAFNQGEGKVIKGIEDFEESIQDIGLFDAFDDSLESGVANSPDGFPYPVGMTGLPNLTVQSNLDHTLFTPNPRGIDGLVAVASGNSGAVSDVVVSDFAVDSFDLIFTGEKTGVGFSLISFGGAQAVEVNVFSTTNVHLGEMASIADRTGNSFIGVWSAIPIGRINIFDVEDGFEGADRIQAWGEADPCPWDLDGSGAVGTADLLALFAQWGQVGTSADFDGGGVSTSDLLILFANWGPCPLSAECANPGSCEGGFPDCGDAGCICVTLFDGSGFCVDTNLACQGLELCPDGDCPPGQVCAILTCCGDNVCIPEEFLCGNGGLAPPPPGTKTISGIAGQN